MTVEHLEKLLGAVRAWIIAEKAINNTFSSLHL